MRNGLAAFADMDFPIAVPRPTPYLHAREAFLYLVSFIALYVSAISFGFLVFGLIDHTFHDPLAYRDRFPSTGEATSIASVIVAFPLYLFLMKRLASEMAAEPEKRRSLVRRWLTYLTLVIAAGFILGGRDRPARKLADRRPGLPILTERPRHTGSHRLHIRVLPMGHAPGRRLWPSAPTPQMPCERSWA